MNVAVNNRNFGMQEVIQNRRNEEKTRVFVESCIVNRLLEKTVYCYIAKCHLQRNTKEKRIDLKEIKRIRNKYYYLILSISHLCPVHSGILPSTS